MTSVAPEMHPCCPFRRTLDDGARPSSGAATFDGAGDDLPNCGRGRARAAFVHERSAGFSPQEAAKRPSKNKFRRPGVILTFCWKTGVGASERRPALRNFGEGGSVERLSFGAHATLHDPTLHAPPEQADTGSNFCTCPKAQRAWRLLTRGDSARSCGINSALRSGAPASAGFGCSYEDQALFTQSRFGDRNARGRACSAEDYAQAS